MTIFDFFKATDMEHSKYSMIKSALFVAEIGRCAPLTTILHLNLSHIYEGFEL